MDYLRLTQQATNDTSTWIADHNGLWGWIKMMMISIDVYFFIYFMPFSPLALCDYDFTPKLHRTRFCLHNLEANCWWLLTFILNVDLAQDTIQIYWLASTFLMQRAKIWAELQLASLQNLICIEKCTRNVITPYEAKQPLVGPCPIVKNATTPIICFGCW